MDAHVPLDRQFSPVPRSRQDSEVGEDVFSTLGLIQAETWNDLHRKFRCVILAEAGAGKTEELRFRARALASRQIPAFFIRIEDIDVDFYQAFEVGEEAEFREWLESTEEAWFFLDSVDEARLENPRTFEKALRRFSKGISGAEHRAHIYISSRPYAWRPREDRNLLNEILFLAAPKEDEGDQDGCVNHPVEVRSALSVCVMRPLDKKRIREFCDNRGASNIDLLLREIERTNIWSLAERPFDLEGILSKWAEDEVLGGRLDLLSHNIDKRLRDEHSSDRAQRQPLNTEQARMGARRLAAAVVLTGQAGLNIPGASPEKPGIDAELVLSDWDPADVGALLDRGIFNDVIFGAVRFRHREVRELLAAEWFADLLTSGNSRSSVEGLFFREQYEEKIITPRLRPVLTWLILFDHAIRQRALEIHPEIAVEGGDPSKLPLPERERILTNIVGRIASGKDDRSARDNGAIARIARQDLAEKAHQLLAKYCDNDDAIFFLGRLVWQGELARCVPPFVAVALDESRGIYARIASVRAVVTCGADDQKRSLLSELISGDAQIPRELLVEIVDELETDCLGIDNLLISIDKLAPSDRYQSSGLSHSLRNLVDRIPLSEGRNTLLQLIDGMHDFLIRTPYVDQNRSRLSKEYVWLLSPALRAVERLVKARNAGALEAAPISIMLMPPALRFHSDVDFREHNSELHELVPSWPALNDTLYWASIDQEKARNAGKTQQPVTNDWYVSWLGHYWKFDQDSLPRLLGYIGSKTSQDDQLVALSTAFRVYEQAGKPEEILIDLQDTVSGKPVLEGRLHALLYPSLPEAARQYEEEHAELLRKQNDEEEKERQARETWIAKLRADPDRVRYPPELQPGQWSKDHLLLLHEVHEQGTRTNHREGADWQALIPDFGEAVAEAYRDAAMTHWRHYSPALQSEGVEKNNRIPLALIFGLAGLEIEAAEVVSFPHHLEELDVLQALRYITWELNGFPTWFERMHRTFPSLATDAVLEELLWEVRHTESGKPMHYALHDTAYYAAWIHSSVAPALLECIETTPAPVDVNHNDCLHILINGGIGSKRLAMLARRKISLAGDQDSTARWFALYVDCNPVDGIRELKRWLSDLPEGAAGRAAQVFITGLMGSRHFRDDVVQIGSFRAVEHLTALYLLMHRYILATDDINRAGGGVYSPELRDDAQDARDSLFRELSGIPGKATYVALRQLARDHPNPEYRPRMTRLAYKRAEEDGDIEPWTPKQVCAFGKQQTVIPETHRQLFSLTVQRLLDLKSWVERGHDSPWETWQRANGETEVRTLIAGWLNQHCSSLYTTAQEPELANKQRIDIWVDNTSVSSPVPIELKLLDKGWSGPKLCERLRNQLVGDYLREEQAGCGVMLLVFQGKKGAKRWKIDGQSVGINELGSALKHYWESISGRYLGVEAVEVVVIDLTLRAYVSEA